MMPVDHVSIENSHRTQSIGLEWIMIMLWSKRFSTETLNLTIKILFLQRKSTNDGWNNIPVVCGVTDNNKVLKTYKD